MRTSAAGNDAARGPARPRGFTLLELLVVLALVAVATAGVSLSLRDADHARLEREAVRLAALLDAARAQSRASGIPARWQTTADGFRFSGLQGSPWPTQWLHADTRAAGDPVLVLGPEPMIPPQSLVLTRAGASAERVRIRTDGLHPFTVQAEPAAR